MPIPFIMTPLTDISGWTISFELKSQATDTTALLTIAASLTTPTLGLFTVTVSAAQTLTLLAGQYVYDVWRTDTGFADALALGSFAMKSSVRVP